MLRKVSVEDSFDDELSRLDLFIVRHVLNQVAVILPEEDVEACSQMVVLKHTLVAVTNSERMLRPDHELVVVAWMLVVMDEASDEGGEVVMLLQTLLDAALLQQEVQSLHAVQYVDDIMIRVLFEVSKLDFCREIDHCFKLHMVHLEEVVVLEDLERQELK